MKNISSLAVSLVSLVLVLFVPLPAVALEAGDASAPVYSSPVIITELQTGGTTASDEFVELYNASSVAVDINGWQVRFVNASATSRDTTLLATIAASTPGAPVILPPHAYYVLHTSSINVPPAVLGQVYSAKLSNADKAVGLFAPDSTTCQLQIRDAVAWGASNDGEGQAASVTGLSQSADRLVQRYRNTAGFYVDTSHNDYDFKVLAVTKDATNPAGSLGATMGTDNVGVATGSAPASGGMGSTLAPVAIDGCTLPSQNPTGGNQLGTPTTDPPSTDQTLPNDTDTPADSVAGPSLPAGDAGLNPPQLTELLPNPAAPLTDADDEFIELYNSNDQAFDMSGFTLVAAKRHYTFPAGTIIESKSFKAFFSAQTHLSLSNTSGHVQLLDPFGNVLDETSAYGAAKENTSWALANGTWQWTTTPTPNAANVIAVALAKTTKSTAKPSGATSKTGSVKGVTTQKAAKKTTTSTPAATNTALVSRNPIHPGVLALVSSFALLYGAYEYRSDVANRIHQFRLYRAARREARQQLAGRRGD